MSSLVETLNPRLGSYLSFVAPLAKRIGQVFGLDKKEQEQIEIAGLLHDIGLLGLPKILLEKDMEDMVEAELKLFKQHPIVGQICLQPVERLDLVGAIVYSHHENYDGSGFPDGLHGEQIPLGARIVHVAAAYAGFVRRWPKDIGEIRQRTVKYLGHSAKNIVTDDPQILIQEVAKQLLFRQANQRYDPDLVSKLVQILQEDQQARKNPKKIHFDFLVVPQARNETESGTSLP